MLPGRAERVSLHVRNVHSGDVGFVLLPHDVHMTSSTNSETSPATNAAIGSLLAVVIATIAAIVLVTTAGTSASASVSAIDADRVAPAGSIYCRTVAGREPARPAADASSTAAGAAWTARRDFEFRADLVAPADIATDWQLVDSFTRDHVMAAAAGHGTANAAVPTEPTEVRSARTRIASFDAEVCGVDTIVATTASASV